MKTVLNFAKEKKKNCTVPLNMYSLNVAVQANYYWGEKKL